MLFRILFMSVCWCCLFMEQGSTQTSDLPIHYCSTEKLIDGLPDDWPAQHLQDFTLENMLQASQEYNNQATVKLEWDEQYLYGFINITDKKLIKLRGGHDNPTLNLGDAVEIYIDPMNDSEDRMDVNDYQFIMDVGADFAVLKGSKALIAEDWYAPKTAGEATVAFKFKTSLIGTLNQEQDRDSLWRLEFALPWAALGKIPGRDSVFRLDVCLDDMDALMNLDTVPEGLEIPAFSYISWNGARDFSYPDLWKTCRLTGGPDLLTTIGRSYLRVWPLATSLVLIISGIIIWYLFRKIRRLRRIPVRHEIGQNLLMNLILQKPYEPTGEQPNALFFESLRCFVLEHLHEDLSPEQLAQKACISLRQLQRIFKDELNSTPATFIVLIKMERAAELLRQGNSNVSEIAYDLGFSDPGYFGKVFKKYFGVTPREFAGS
ncbi:MAG: helix-turn-helix domain-containing protein [Saprospiraceae bacterium]|nr:helix-turn-helix domain-containing protein [Saprospiraceae bacterium]